MNIYPYFMFNVLYVYDPNIEWLFCINNNTYSLSTSATEHLYWAVENKQMSANCLTDTLIFLTGLLELF